MQPAERPLALAAQPRVNRDSPCGCFQRLEHVSTLATWQVAGPLQSIIEPIPCDECPIAALVGETDVWAVFETHRDSCLYGCAVSRALERWTSQAPSNSRQKQCKRCRAPPLFLDGSRLKISHFVVVPQTGWSGANSDPSTSAPLHTRKHSPVVCRYAAPPSIFIQCQTLGPGC